MSLKYEEPDGHWAVTFCQQRMASTEHFGEPDLVVIAFSHFTPVHGDHVIMQPVACGHVIIADRALRDLTFMMRELEIHSSAMNVEFGAEIFCAHGRALYVPPGKTLAPRTCPPHNMLRGSRLP